MKNHGSERPILGKVFSTNWKSNLENDSPSGSLNKKMTHLIEQSLFERAEYLKSDKTNKPPINAKNPPLHPKSSHDLHRHQPRLPLR